MTRILLVKPEYRQTLEVTPPLGICYLAAVARQNSHEVRILDNRLRDQGYDCFDQTLRKWRPDVIGISAVSFEAAAARRLAERTRSVLPKSKVLIGGPFASVDPESAVLRDLIDYAVIGEGERVLPEMLARFKTGQDPRDIPGIAFRNPQGVLVKTKPSSPIEDLDALPFPAWDLLDMEAYFRAIRQGFVYKHRRYFSIFTSRGCPYNCIFCHGLFGKVFRGRQPGRVLAEIEHLVSVYGVREIQILDDLFNLDIERAAGILQGVIDRRWRVALGFVNGLRGDLLNEQIIDLMKKAGTYRACIAVESGSKRIQSVIKKNLNLERVRQSINSLVRRRILTNLFFMIGLPTETKEDVLATARFANTTNAHSATFIFANPFPGTEFGRISAEQGNPSVYDSESANYFDPRTADLIISDVAPDEIRAIVRKAYLSTYIRPQRLWRIFRDTPRRRQLPFFAMVILTRALGLFPRVFQWKRWRAEHTRRSGISLGETDSRTQ